MAQAMPYDASHPCAACARLLDPLRTRAIAVDDEGFRFFCGADCKAIYRASRNAKPARVPTPAFAMPARGDEVASLHRVSLPPTTRGPAVPPSAAQSWPVIAAA